MCMNMWGIIFFNWHIRKETMSNNNLNLLYETLYNHYGPQYWWPGDTTFEIMVGAILTQNTNWTNVEKAIKNLIDADALSLEVINKMEHDRLAELIRPAGYFNVKTKRLKAFTEWLAQNAGEDLESLKSYSLSSLREQLLAVKGIGKETADSILLYALGMPTFVVDTYTYRVFTRHQLIEPEADYDELRDFCMWNLEEDIQLYNEFHALLVMVGKNHCKPKPKCQGCPLEHLPHEIEMDF